METPYSWAPRAVNVASEPAVIRRILAADRQHQLTQRERVTPGYLDYQQVRPAAGKATVAQRYRV